MNRKQRRPMAKPQPHVVSRLAGAVAQNTDKDLAAALRHHRAGRIAQAENCYREILAIEPNYIDALHSYGLLALESGRNSLAIELISKAIALNDRVAAFHNHMGLALRRVGRLDDAVAHLARATKLNPNFAAAYVAFGDVMQEQGKFGEAASKYQQALSLNQELVRVRNALGFVLQRQGKLQEAITEYQRTLTLKPDDADVHNHLGLALQEQGKVEAALTHFQQALAINPNGAKLNNSLGSALRDLGRLEEANDAYKKAIDLAPRNPLFYFNLVGVKRIAPGDPEILAMEKLASDSKLLSIDDRIYLHFALGKAYGDLRDHERSFQYLLEGNALKRQQISYDEVAERILSERIQKVFSPELMRDKRDLGDPSRIPVFIVGMPRSGTTLVEQILASHPKVFGGGELLDFAEPAAGLRREFPEAISRMDSPKLREFGARYVTAVQRVSPDAERITDKLPGNYRLIGLINLALPNARVIHARRDPLDTCFSCFSKLFAGDHIPYSYDLTELGHVYRNYEALMAHWRRVLPPEVLLEVQYEEVVADLEGQARRIVAHCGLQWDDRCLFFHQTKRPVQTLSTIEVRQPIYRTSVGRWCAYEQQLRPLNAALRTDAGALRLPNLEGAAEGWGNGLTVMVKPATTPNVPGGQAAKSQPGIADRSRTTCESDGGEP
jgi:tetratricopeptide (TPR) repeat protein